MATVSKKAMCVLRFFETKSVIETQCCYRNQYRKDLPSDNSIPRRLKQLRCSAPIKSGKTEHFVGRCWSNPGSLDILLSWKAHKLKLFNILQHWFYRQQNFLSYTFIFHKQFCLCFFQFKIIGHGNPNNNLDSPCIKSELVTASLNKVQ
jgi:hypothetical protein